MSINNKTTKTDGIFWAKNFATGISDAVLLLDKQYNLTWWNEIASRSLFISKYKHANKPVIDLFNSQTFTDYILEKQIGTVEFSLPKQPDKMLSVVLIPYGKVFILVAQDISKKNHIDKIRQDFIANVSHEMRTPLTVIHGYLEIMQEEVSEAFPLYEPFFIQMQQQMQRLENLLQDLLLLSRIQKGKLKANDLSIVKASEIIKDLAENTKNTSNGKHQFTLHIDDSLQIIGQEKELRSCFENLIINAIRYSPDGGEIIISWYADDNGVYFSVKDHGIGIKPSDIPRLTERFYRVDKGRSRNTGGTGLGLAIVKHVLIRHQGSIEISSEVNIGSTFTCCFPKNFQR
jgi:two-component system phosphate regulon sensor histidine kinase PhoR